MKRRGHRLDLRGSSPVNFSSFSQIASGPLALVVFSATCVYCLLLSYTSPLPLHSPHSWPHHVLFLLWNSLRTPLLTSVCTPYCTSLVHGVYIALLGRARAAVAARILHSNATVTKESPARTTWTNKNSLSIDRWQRSSSTEGFS